MTPIGCPMHSRILRGAVAAALALASGACASTGAVPRPFPIPGGAPTASTAAVARIEGASDMYAVTGTALALRGSPYRNGGADPTGFDCSGFTQYVFAQHGLALPREVREQFRLGSAVKPENMAVGDLIFFTTVGAGASHVGIALGGDEFIHAPSAAGVVRVERLSASYWSRRFAGARRLN
jgi:cell wall-associated NlpC family hydrolase